MATDVALTDDEHLVGADPALPGLAILLHDAELTRFLRQRNPHVRTAHATYLRYKPGTAVAAAVRVGTDSGERLALAQAVTRAGRPKLDKLALAAKERRTWCYLDEALSMAVAGAGADRHLPGLHRELARTRVHTVRYKPGRRWVGRRGRGRRAELTKVFHGDQARYAATAARALVTAEVAGPVLRTERAHRNTLTFSWAEGITLDRVDQPDLAAAGGLLAQLHQVPWPLPTTPGRNWRAVVFNAGAGVQDLAQAVPDLGAPAAQARQIVADLAALLPGPDVPLVTSHGDCSADQMLAEPGGSLRILDLDSLLQAPREYDLGEWIGEHLVRVCPAEADQVSLSDLTTATVAAHAPMLAGYRNRARSELAMAGTLTMAAAAVLNRAAEPFRTRHPEWISAARTRVSLAAHLTRRAQEAAAAPPPVGAAQWPGTPE